MAEKKISINQVFPDEILEKILKNLDIESLCSARRSCQRWMKIVDNIISKIQSLFVYQIKNIKCTYRHLQ